MSVQDSLWDGVDDDSNDGGGTDARPQPVRGTRASALADSPAGGVPADPRAGQDGLLRPPGRGDRGEGQPADGGASGPGGTGDGNRVQGPVRAAEHAAPHGRAASARRDAAGPAGEAGPSEHLTRFRPTSQADLAPSGQAQRIFANLEALATLRGLQEAHRAASPDEQRILARWSGFGAVPGVFDRTREDFAEARARLAELTSEDEYRDLRRTTLNAHYTHARYVELIWDALGQLGFSGGRGLEPGCGSGNFIGLAPDGAEMTGIERDPVTSAIAAALYPHAEIRAESFADTRIRAGYFDAAVGNVPFGKFKLSDPGHNPGRRLSIHNHFIVKALALTRPGGIVALLTSRYTMDSRNPEARRQIAGLADLVAAIRLPT